MKFSLPSLFCNCPRNIEATLDGLIILLGKIFMTLEELTQVLNDTKAQLVKAAGEITAKIDALEAQLATVVTTPEVDAALAELKAVAQQLDDINPDVVE
jgi:ABC-type transporter Mla subunit MlaD